eukprot:9477298-Pyramimonas_sp.AAC.1
MNACAAEAQENLHERVRRWAWRRRRANCPDAFSELASAVRVAQERGCMWWMELYAALLSD